ncbi:hypothetical protein BH11BAC7_BH11BAC7_12060 [soil metagenome]
MALQSNLERIDALKKEAESLRPVSSERLKILNDKLRLDWNYNSNAIEGNTLTLSETRMLLMHGFHTGNKLGRHYEEMKLHNDVLLTLEDLVQKKEPITEVLIRNLHHQLMGNEYFVKANDSLGNLVNVKGRPGEYKNKPNGVNRIINGKEQFVPFKTPDDVRIEMPELIQWYRDQEEKKELHPVALAAAFHFRFVTLHPFDDGNGRMSRILMNMILMRAGFVPAIIRLGEREKYIYALAQGQDGESLEPFVELVAEEVERSLQLLIKAAKGESIEEADDFDKKIALLEREVDIISSENIKNDQTLIVLWQDCLFLLIERYFKKFHSFEKLFNGKEIKIYNGLGNIYKWEQVNKWFMDESTDRENINDITFHYKFIDMKKIHFNINSSLVIQFHPARYEVKLELRTIEKKYNQFISEEEMEEIINERAEDFLKTIQAELDKANS